MRVHRGVQSAGVIAACVLTVGLLGGCEKSGSGGGTGSSGAGAQNTSAAPGTAAGAGAAATSAAAAGSASGAKCSDLTAAAASQEVGKATTVTLDTSAAALPGLTICNVTVADEVYPIQLSVDTSNAQELFNADMQASSGVDLGGVGDKAFSSATGIEALSGGVDIKIFGPAGPVMNKNYTVPIALAKAMISTLK